VSLKLVIGNKNYSSWSLRGWIALAQAGLDSSKTNLEFSLRQNPFAHQEQGQGGHGRSPFAPPGGTAEAEEPLPAPHIIAYRGSATAGGVNLFV